jgi:hypothetical protein
MTSNDYIQLIVPQYRCACSAAAITSTSPSLCIAVAVERSTSAKSPAGIPLCGTKSANLSRKKERTHHSPEEEDDKVEDDDLPEGLYRIYNYVLRASHVPDAEVDNDVPCMNSEVAFALRKLALPEVRES